MEHMVWRVLYAIGAWQENCPCTCESCQQLREFYKRNAVTSNLPAATQEQPAGSGATTNEHELLVGGIVRAALELAILRGDLRMDSGDAFEEMSESEREDVISDTWNAMNGEGTCDDEPVKELTAIYAALGSPRKVGEDGPVYRKVLYKGPPEHATPLWLISCDEGWRSSIVCEGMYEWAADWLLEQIQGKPFAPTNRPGARSSSVPVGEQK